MSDAPRVPPAYRRAAWGSVLVLGVVALWWSPVSPFALERGDVLLGLGNIEGAVAHYDRVASFHPSSDTRHRALLRSAVALSVDLQDATAARVRLQQLVEEQEAPAELRAAAWGQLGHLLMAAFDAPDEAAGAFTMAYEAAPQGPDAAQHLVDAARAVTEGGKLDAAHQAWERVLRRFPAERGQARLAQASILLAKGRVSQALDAYEDAAESATDDRVRQAARLGAATCKERQGRIQAALAEIAAAELPAHLEELRQTHLEDKAAAED